MHDSHIDGGRSSRGATYLLGVLVLAYIISFIDRQIVSLLVPDIRRAFGVGDLEVALIQGVAFSIPFCLVSIPVGFLVDRYRRKYLLLLGVLIWTATTALCAFVESYPMLFLARMGVGAGEAFVAPTAYSMITDAFRKDRVVRALSIFTLAGALGAGLAFLTGGIALQAIYSRPSLAFGLEPWRAAFIIVSLPSALVILMMALTREPRRMDVSAAERPLRLAEACRLLWRVRGDFLPIFACASLLGIPYYGSMSWFAAHLVRMYGCSSAQAGLILGAVYLVCPLIGTIFGTMVTESFQRAGRSDAPMRTISLIALIAIPTSLAGAVTSLPLAIALLATGALALGSYYGNLVGALQMVTPPRVRGLNSSFYVIFNSLMAQAVGLAVIGAMSDRLFAGRPDGLGLSLATLSVICSIIAAMLSRRTLPRFGSVVRASWAEKAAD
ncbi:MFS transporter [Sphingobium tyrosinilyticum]|uniref:MFS transporter n=1 Tax=Sphingobium tyrosinilyticum TaxID=2715436 RepID=A0ABV9F1M3_9SPHN